MGVTFWGNFASRTLLVPFHWRSMCYAHQFSREEFSREGSLCAREAEETAPDPWSAFTSSISTTLVAPVIGTMTPVTSSSFCRHRPASLQCQHKRSTSKSFWRLTGPSSICRARYEDNHDQGWSIV